MPKGGEQANRQQPAAKSSPMDVAVIGLGYVGLPLCRAMWAACHRVLAIDIDQTKVETLMAGRCYLQHLGSNFVQEMQASGRFEATTDAARLAQCDAVLICVPTPLNAQNEPDLSYVTDTVRQIAAALQVRGRSQIIVLESTTYPGTTRDVVKPILDGAAVAYHLAFSPERVDPGRTGIDETAIPKLIGGIDEVSTNQAASLYATAFEKVIPVRSAEVAEAAKLLENIYRAVNIALVNEMKVVLDQMGIDVWEVVAAAATKPFGFAPFYPGPGLGGHCIPIDPFYFAWKAQQVGASARFIELAGQVNASMPGHVVDTTLRAIGASDGSASRILVLGLAYKANIDDVRESPSFELIRLFRQHGCIVDYSDPHVPQTHAMRRWGDLDMTSVAIDARSLASYDAIVVATAHDAFDWPLIARHSPLIIDTRNALADYPEARVVKA